MPPKQHENCMHVLNFLNLDPGVPGRLSHPAETMDVPSELWRQIFQETNIAEEIMFLSMNFLVKRGYTILPRNLFDSRHHCPIECSGYRYRVCIYIYIYRYRRYRYCYPCLSMYLMDLPSPNDEHSY